MYSRAYQRLVAIPPLLWVAAFWLMVTVVASLIILPRAKGAVVGQQWALCMHGFGAEGDRT